MSAIRWAAITGDFLNLASWILLLKSEECFGPLSLGKYTWAQTCLCWSFTFSLRTWIKCIFGIKSHHLNDFYVFIVFGRRVLHAILKKGTVLEIFIILIHIFSSYGSTFEFYITILFHFGLLLLVDLYVYPNAQKEITVFDFLN